MLVWGSTTAKRYRIHLGSVTKDTIGTGWFESPSPLLHLSNFTSDSVFTNTIAHNVKTQKMLNMF